MKQIRIFFTVLALWTVIGMLSKVFFITAYYSLLPAPGMADCLGILWHGLRLDIAVGGYLTVIPGVILTLTTWRSAGFLRMAWNVYFAITAFLCSLAYVSNLGLYKYWGFPLDSTPLLYISTSPSAALASIPVWQSLLFAAIIIVVAMGIYATFARLGRRLSAAQSRVVPIVMVLLTASLIIPIRGGLDTGTNHTGSVYFSSDIRMNHAAVNPLFSFVESATHREEIATRYRFMEAKEATRIFDKLTYTHLRKDATQRHDYNVIIIGLESFSKYIMTEAGHVKGVTPNLDRYANEGIYFTNFYASSFRTDRGLVAMLSGLPAQPTMSVMDIPRISTSLPSMARTLAANGYRTHFYYGGDTNYSNMRSYLMGTGYGEITSQYEFSSALNTGKWGVADGPVFDRLLDDIKHEGANGGKPFFKTFMTSSSHEPFDVPDFHRLPEPELNAFAYTDHYLGVFIEALKTLPCWKNTLVVIVPDHLGAYPQHADNYQLWRYEIPMIMLGGMITEPRKVDTIGSQTDISATVLALLGLEHEEFTYSKDLFDPEAPHYAFFSFPDAIGMVSKDGYAIYDNTSGKIATHTGDGAETLATQAKALLQKLYDDLGSR